MTTKERGVCNGLVTGTPALRHRGRRSQEPPRPGTAGKLHCLEVTIDAAKAPISVTLRHSALKMPQSGGSSYEVFEAKTFGGKTIAGRFYRRQQGMTFDDVPYTYDVTFEAPNAPKSASGR
jgi:hypothetical protein